MRISDWSSDVCSSDLVDFAELNVHAMSLSSHKVNGPQGAGALILDKRVDMQPLLYGGGQEKGLRSGSENVAAIVGFGMACELATRELEQRTAAIRRSEERRVGKEKVSTCRYRGCPYH